MKLTFLLFFACICSYTCNIQAQRTLGISDINVSVLTGKQGIGCQASYERFFGENNKKSLQIGIRYLNSRADLDNSRETVRLNDFTFHAVARRYFNAGALYPYIGLGPFLGYQSINDQGLKESVLLDRKDTLLYGVQANAGLEYFLPFGSLFVETNPEYEGKLGEFHLVFNAGIKFFF